jgi:hypothetical protein
MGQAMDREILAEPVKVTPNSVIGMKHEVIVPDYVSASLDKRQRGFGITLDIVISVGAVDEDYVELLVKAYVRQLSGVRQYLPNAILLRSASKIPPELLFGGPFCS